jgi:CheY-like chemotaxis protein
MNVVKQKFKVVAATSGQQAITMVEKSDPDLVLLDVTMPEVDGYEVCRQVKNMRAELPVIFISANDSTDEILKGYDVGGADYIVKPFSPDVLLNKIQGAFENQQQADELKKEADYASEVAMAAISSSSELSTVVSFLRDSFHALDVRDLLRLINRCLKDYGLSGSVQLRSVEGDLDFSMTGPVSSLESELLSRIAVMPERIKELKNRMFLNFDKASLLIKNLPMDDSDRVGRLRDYLMILIEGINERLVFFDAQVSAEQQRADSVSNVISEVKTSLDHIYQLQSEIEKQNVSIMDNLADDIDHAFIGLGLSEEQEEQIMNLLHQAQDASSDVFKKGQQVEIAMRSVLSKLSDLKD